MRHLHPSTIVPAAVVLALGLSVVAIAAPGGAPPDPVDVAAVTDATDVVVDTATDAVTDAPSDQPTDTPTDAMSDEPTVAPTDEPTLAPTDAPSDEPTDAPSDEPTDAPTDGPTDAPTDEPTDRPTDEPTERDHRDHDRVCDDPVRAVGQALEAGAIHVAACGHEVRLLEVRTAEGWHAEVEHRGGRYVEVHFERPAALVRIRATVDDRGEIVFRVDGERRCDVITDYRRARVELDDGRVLTAGGLHVEACGDRIRLTDLLVADGWTAEVDSREGRHVDVEFERPGARLKARASVEDGRIVWRFDGDARGDGEHRDD